LGLVSRKSYPDEQFTFKRIAGLKARWVREIVHAWLSAFKVHGGIIRNPLHRKTAGQNPHGLLVLAGVTQNGGH
jgi:hypothetical protein